MSESWTLLDKQRQQYIKTDWSVSAYFSADVSIYTNVKNCLTKPLMNDKIVNVINFFTERISKYNFA